MPSAVPFNISTRKHLIGSYKFMLQTKMLTATSVGNLKMTGKVEDDQAAEQAIP